MSYTKFELFQSVDRAIIQAGKISNAPEGGVMAGVIYGPFYNLCFTPLTTVTAAQYLAGEKTYTPMYAHPDCTVRCHEADAFNAGEAVFSSGGVVRNFAAAGNLPCVGMVLEARAAHLEDPGWVRILFNGINCREVDGTMNYA